MASTTWNNPNYVAQLLKVGRRRTAFLDMIGGLNGGRYKTTRTKRYDMSEIETQTAQTQGALTQDNVAAGVAATNIASAVEVNHIQYEQEQISVAYIANSVTQEVMGSTTTGLGGGQPTNFNVSYKQLERHLRKMALRINASFLNGTYAESTASNVAPKTRGIITGCTSNTVAAAAATLTKDMMNELLNEMTASGAAMEMPVVFVSGNQKVKLSTLYGNAIESTNIGGFNIQTIITDFGNLGVVLDQDVPTTTLLIADVAYCQPVFLPVISTDRNGVQKEDLILIEDKSSSGASQKTMIYSHIGLDYGTEKYHGTITGLKV